MRSQKIRFVELQNQLNSKLVKKLDGQLSVHGISYTEYMILHFLHSAPNTTLRRVDLAEQVGITASGVTRLLAPMTKIGLVEKEINPRDARVSLVKLSKAGAKIYRESSVSFSACAADLTENISHDQLKTWVEISSQLI